MLTPVICGDCEGLCEHARADIDHECLDDLCDCCGLLWGSGVLVRDKHSLDLVWWRDHPVRSCPACIKLGKPK